MLSILRKNFKEYPFSYCFLKDKKLQKKSWCLIHIVFYVEYELQKNPWGPIHIVFHKRKNFTKYPFGLIHIVSIREKSSQKLLGVLFCFPLWEKKFTKYPGVLLITCLILLLRRHLFEASLFLSLIFWKSITIATFYFWSSLNSRDMFQTW